MTLLEQYREQQQQIELLEEQCYFHREAIKRIEEKQKAIHQELITPSDLLCAALDAAGLEYYVYGGKWETRTLYSITSLVCMHGETVSVTYNFETNTLLIEGEEVKPLLAAA